MGYSSPYTEAFPTTHISRQQPTIPGPDACKVASTMDTQLVQQDDLNLMGLQELDSHLSIFESSLVRDSSTPDNGSNSASGESLKSVSQQSHRIIVESPDEIYLPPRPQYQAPRAKFMDPRFNHAGRYVLFTSRSFHILLFECKQ